MRETQCAHLSFEFRQDAYPVCFIRRGEHAYQSKRPCSLGVVFPILTYSTKGSSRVNAHHDYATLTWSCLAKPAPQLVTTAVIIFVIDYMLAVWISWAVRRMLIRFERIGSDG